MRKLSIVPWLLLLAPAACARSAAPPPAPVAASDPPAASNPPATPTTPISVEGFRDGIKHYQNANDRSNYARLDPADARAIAENILLHQRDNGGFAPNWDPLRVLDEAEKAKVRAESKALDTSFDNRGTYPQIEYLAQVFQRTGEVRFREASLRGIAFVLDAQYENGGYPHSFPSQDEYRPHVTIMDEVMPGVLTLLRKASEKRAPFAFVPEGLRARAAVALERGDRCLLALQVVVQGTKTVWAGQYDERSLTPTRGRSYELPSLVSDESVSVVEYLMRIESPSPEVREAVEAAVAWFERSKIRGIRLERFAAEPVRYKWHTSTEDVRVVEDASAPPLWARFYDIGTNRPFMANRDGNKVYTLAEVERERRTGYRWYGDFATQLLEREYPAWKQRFGR